MPQGSREQGARSLVPRDTDLSERPGARDLAPGSHRLGALGPSQPRNGRVRSVAMAPIGTQRETIRGATSQQKRGLLKDLLPQPGLASYTDLDQGPLLRVRNLTGERLPVMVASSPRVPPPAAPSGSSCISGPNRDRKVVRPNGGVSEGECARYALVAALMCV